MIRPQVTRTWRTLMPRSHRISLEAKSFCSAARTSTTAGANIVMREGLSSRMISINE
jgi:hypothetical protein